MINAKITGVGGFVPEDIMTNQDFEKIMDTSDEWITSRTGIKERRILKGKGLGTSYMGLKAVQDLLIKSGTKATEIDLLIVGTVTPDMFFPNSANLICDELGIHGVPSFDLSAACSGFLYSLETGSNFIKSGKYKKVVIVGADKMSSIMNYEDRTTSIIFGDGAGAALLEPGNEGEGVIDTIIHSDGTGKELIYMKAGGSRYPSTEESVKAREHYFVQDGKQVYKYAVTRLADVTLDIMNRNNLSGEDINWFVPHQANKRIIEATAGRMGIGMDKVTMNISRYGNTTAGTIPLCLWDWEKKFKKGDNIILAAFGAGFTWGASYVKWAY